MLNQQSRKFAFDIVQTVLVHSCKIIGSWLCSRHSRHLIILLKFCIELLQLPFCFITMSYIHWLSQLLYDDALDKSAFLWFYDYLHCLPMGTSEKLIFVILFYLEVLPLLHVSGRLDLKLIR